jgi:hypothetical protein
MKAHAKVELARAPPRYVTERKRRALLRVVLRCVVSFLSIRRGYRHKQMTMTMPMPEAKNKVRRHSNYHSVWYYSILFLVRKVLYCNSGMA